MRITLVLMHLGISELTIYEINPSDRGPTYHKAVHGFLISLSLSDRHTGHSGIFGNTTK